MPEVEETGRSNQRRRTRKDLLAAAGKLLKAGRTPSMDDVANEAAVSRATAYRYFPSIEALLIEAPLEGEMPTPQEIFAADSSTDPEARIDKAEAALHDMVYRNEGQLRMMLAATIERPMKRSEDGIPVRQNRRAGLIEAALAPARQQFTKANYDKLCAALSLIFGTESMIVFNDVLRVDEKTARKVKSWAAKALVRAAMEK